MHRFITALAFTLALLFHGTGLAQEISAGAVPMQVTLRQEPAAFAEPFYSAFVVAGENKFTFVIPQGFRLIGDPATGRVSLGNQEGDSLLVFTILNSSPAEAGSFSAEAARTLILQRHPGGKILREFSAGVVGRSGPAFDIQWKAAENIYQCERVAYIPTAFGTMMFSATSGRSKFPAIQGGFGLVTGSFRGSSDGKFRPVHIEGVN